WRRSSGSSCSRAPMASLNVVGQHADTPGMNPASRRLGEFLVERKVLSRDALEEMLAREEAEEVPLPRLLISSGLVGEKDLVAAVAHQVGMRFVDLVDTEIPKELDGLLPTDLARSLLAVAVGAAGGALVVAMADPSQIVAVCH